MLDGDEVNTRNQEERAYFKWEREQKNRILNMSNVARKVKAWRALFPPPEVDLEPFDLTPEQLKEINDTIY